jgi:hypothetical protein
VSARDAIHKVRSVELVRLDDPGYLSSMSEQALAHRHYGPKEEQTATYRASALVEEAVRSWLGARVSLLPDRVLSAEVLYRDARAYESVYLELDAVEGRDGEPVRLYEVKFTSNLNAMRRGYGQLARAIRLLESRHDRVEGVVILVPAHGGVFDSTDPRLADLARIAPDDLDDPALPRRPLVEIELDVVRPYLSPDGCTLLEAALLEGEANVAAREERAARSPDDAAPPLPDRPRRQGATIAFGDDDGAEPTDSPFAVLKGLAGSGDRGSR